MAKSRKNIQPNAAEQDFDVFATEGDRKAHEVPTYAEQVEARESESNDEDEA